MGIIKQRNLERGIENMTDGVIEQGIRWLEELDEIKEKIKKLQAKVKNYARPPNLTQ